MIVEKVQVETIFVHVSGFGRRPVAALVSVPENIQSFAGTVRKGGYVDQIDSVIQKNSTLCRH